MHSFDVSKKACMVKLCMVKLSRELLIKTLGSISHLMRFHELSKHMLLFQKRTESCTFLTLSLSLWL